MECNTAAIYIGITTFTISHKQTLPVNSKVNVWFLKQLGGFPLQQDFMTIN